MTERQVCLAAADGGYEPLERTTVYSYVDGGYAVLHE
jgi:hypothetical protein